MSDTLGRKDGFLPIAFVGIDGVSYGVIPSPAAGSLSTIDVERHKTSIGEHYFVANVNELAINNVLDITIQTPNTAKWINFNWQIGTESETTWFFYENVVATNALANAEAVFNNDRNSTNTSGAILKYEIQGSLAVANADTDVTSATTLEAGISGAGKDSGSDTRSNEIILKQNTIYLLRFTAVAAGYVDYRLRWYEHQNLA